MFRIPQMEILQMKTLTEKYFHTKRVWRTKKTEVCSSKHLQRSVILQKKITQQQFFSDNLVSEISEKLFFYCHFFFVVVQFFQNFASYKNTNFNNVLENTEDPPKKVSAI